MQTLGFPLWGKTNMAETLKYFYFLVVYLPCLLRALQFLEIIVQHLRQKKAREIIFCRKLSHASFALSLKAVSCSLYSL